MRLPPQRPEHGRGRARVAGLAVGALAVVDDRVGADDDRARVAAGDGRGLLTSEAPGVGAGVVGRALVEVRGVDRGLVEEGAQQLVAAGRG